MYTLNINLISANDSLKVAGPIIVKTNMSEYLIYS